MPDDFKNQWGAEYFQINYSHFKRLNLYGNSVTVSDQLKDIVQKIIFAGLFSSSVGLVLRSSLLWGPITHTAQRWEWAAWAGRRVRTTCTDIRYYTQYHKVLVCCIGIIVSWFSLLFVNKSHKLLLPLLPVMLGRTELASAFHLKDKELHCSIKFFSIYIQVWKSIHISILLMLQGDTIWKLAEF